MRDEQGWTIIDEATSEVEMQELLLALVRMLKPDLVVETGCHRGYATYALGRGVALNGRGRVVSCDTDNVYAYITRAKVGGLPVEVRTCRGIDLPELAVADFIFTDSDYQCRAEEIAAAKPGAVILVHDTRVSYHSDVPPLEQLVHQLGGLTFYSHRGWGLLRKGS